MLRELDQLPAGLLETDSRALGRLLGGPTLIHLPGARQPPLYVSVLLHGNETVGWEAVRGLLAERIARFGEPRLPRALCLFIGNVAAAAAGLRRLPEQPDYNRIWPGTVLPRSPETDMAAAVVARLRGPGVFASIDLHNNTGTNPHYACVNRLDPRSLQLATLFSRTVVRFADLPGVQSDAFADLCPTVTLECGKVGHAAGVARARALVDAALHLAEVPDHPVANQDIDLFAVVGRLLVRPELSLAMAPESADLMLDPEIERFNFAELPRGTALARVGRPGFGVGIEVRDGRGRDLADRYLHLEDGEVRVRRPLMPAMLTPDLTVIRQDCLGYLLERRGLQP
jgi:succinylglutamate desuccinylase